MKLFLPIILGDYRQRTRSYAFLFTLAISLYMGYTFVPAPSAPYSTVTVGKYIGEFNAAWIGHVTALMASLFVSLIGFFLVNNSVKKDIDTAVGMIIATTRITNFKYLFSKAVSNFLVLLTIVVAVFAMGLLIFLFRSGNHPFELSEFILPYLLVTVPAIFLIACLAVSFEVFLGRFPVIQNVGFFFLFNLVMANVQLSAGKGAVVYADPFGLKVVSTTMQRIVEDKSGEAAPFNMGFNFSPKREIKTFVFDGMRWSAPYVLSRFAWMAVGIIIVFFSAYYFHRFDVIEKTASKGRRTTLPNVPNPISTNEKGIKVSQLPAISTDYGILPFIKTELRMLIRKGSKWLWLLNLALIIAIIFTPLSIAHSILLPLLWFLQVHRLSDLVTKEKTHRIQYFTYSAYRPLQRLLPSQILAAILLIGALGFPLIVRYALTASWVPIAGILCGAIFIVLLSSFLGIVSGGKKLFEILFFLLTYANVNLIPFLDYFGSQWKSAKPIPLLICLSVFFGVVSWFVRRYEIRHS